MELQNLLIIVPELINFFFPGFVFMLTFLKLNSMRLDNYLIVLWSLFTSEILHSLYSLFHISNLFNRDSLELLNIIIYALTALIFAFLLSKLIETQIFKNFLEDFFRITPSGDILKNAMDPYEETQVKIFPKDSKRYYWGTFVLEDEKGFDSYILLINYRIVDKDTDVTIQQELKKSSLLINMHDIEHIELFYEEDSQLWKRLSKYSHSKEEV